MCGISKTELVKKYILKEVKEGKITSGQRLPSCRKMAGLFEVNKITVNKAYEQLEKDKKKVVELCTKYNVIIIEDDYLADLAGKKGAMPLHYYDVDKKTIYIRSFSKAFMPGIRLGAVIAPKSMLEKVAAIKQLMDLNTSRLPQGALELFIKSGMYEKQIKKIRKSYEAKLRKIKEIFISLQPKDLIWNVPENGI